MKVPIEEIRVGGDYREQPMLLLRHYAETHQMLLDALKGLTTKVFFDHPEMQAAIKAIEAASFVNVEESE